MFTNHIVSKREVIDHHWVLQISGVLPDQTGWSMF